jgi:hypothetical protein
LLGRESSPLGPMSACGAPAVNISSSAIRALGNGQRLVIWTKCT